MDILPKKLRERAEQLGISNAEAARRIGLDERRYAHYTSGRREPDLATLLRIAKALGTHPNALLGLDPVGRPETHKSVLLERLISAGESLSVPELRSLTVQAEALAAASNQQHERG
jgi:transcriptional regulator with XRE-family HTH domain